MQHGSPYRNYKFEIYTPIYWHLNIAQQQLTCKLFKKLLLNNIQKTIHLWCSLSAVNGGLTAAISIQSDATSKSHAFTTSCYNAGEEKGERLKGLNSSYDLTFASRALISSNSSSSSAPSAIASSCRSKLMYQFSCRKLWLKWDFITRPCHTYLLCSLCSSRLLQPLLPDCFWKLCSSLTSYRSQNLINLFFYLVFYILRV